MNEFSCVVVAVCFFVVFVVNLVCMYKVLVVHLGDLVFVIHQKDTGIGHGE